MSNQIDSTTVYALFEELKQKIDSLKTDTPKVENSGSNIDEIKALLGELQKQPEDNGLSKKQQEQLQKILYAFYNATCNYDKQQIDNQLFKRVLNIETKLSQRYLFTFDLRGKKIVLALIGVLLLFFFSLGGNILQFSNADQYKDNDLKYRYLKMQGKATPQQIYQLEQTFTYNRNTDSISTILQQVETYEQMVKEQAETIEQTNLGIDKVEKLQKEIDGIKEQGR